MNAPLNNQNKLAQCTKRLTNGQSSDYGLPTAPHWVVGIGIPYSMRAQALSRRAFFVSTVLWWAVWSFLREGRPHAGNANSVQSATHLIGINGGGSQPLHEDTTMSINPLQTHNRALLKRLESIENRIGSATGALRAARDLALGDGSLSRVANLAFLQQDDFISLCDLIIDQLNLAAQETSSTHQEVQL